MTSHSFALVAGRGRFVDDELPAGTLHAAFARSPLPHAVVEGIDVSSVQNSATLIHTADTLNAPAIPAQMRPTAPAAVGMERPVLAAGRVRYVGEPLALVLSPEAAVAEDAAGEVWADLVPLPSVVDSADSLRDDVLLFEGSASNIVDRSELGRGSSQLPDGNVLVELTVHHTRLAATPIETLAILAVPNDGSVDIWCGSQGPHRLQRALAAIFGVDEDVFRVRVPDVGGAFGLKGPLYPEYVAVVAAALRHDRPVLWRERRRESFTGGVHGRAMRHRIRMVGERDGRILGLRLDIVADLGAYPQTGFMVPATAAGIGAGPYRIEDVGVSVTAVVTNTAPTGPYRGAGRPEAALALERAVDDFARQIGMEPVDVRRKNLLRRSDLPYGTPTGARYDSGDYQEALETAVSRIGLPAVRNRQSAQRLEGGDLVGVGFASFVEPAGGPPASGEYGCVELEVDGRLTIRTGATSAGQPHDRLWRGLVAGVFDVEPDTITVITGDTARVAQGEGTFGSRSTQLAGAALVVSARRVLEKATEVAAAIVEASPQDIRLDAGAFVVAGSPGVRVSFSDIAARALEIGVTLREDEFHAPGAQTFPYGTHAAIVTVEPETGGVRIERIVAVDDCGVVVDHAGVDGQLRGGIVQGIGQALLEAMIYGADGQPLTTSMMDYSIPHATDVPPVDLAYLETPSPTVLGAKGVGESGTVGVPAAVLNAVIDALAPYGVTHLQLPLRPESVWRAIEEARRTSEIVP